MTALTKLGDYLRTRRLALGMYTYAAAATASGGLISARRWQTLEEEHMRGVISPNEINGIATALGRPTNEVLNHVQRLA